LFRAAYSTLLFRGSLTTLENRKGEILVSPPVCRTVGIQGDARVRAAVEHLVVANRNGNPEFLQTRSAVPVCLEPSLSQIGGCADAMLSGGVKDAAIIIGSQQAGRSGR